MSNESPNTSSHCYTLAFSKSSSLRLDLLNSTFLIAIHQMNAIYQLEDMQLEDKLLCI